MCTLLYGPFSLAVVPLTKWFIIWSFNRNGQIFYLCLDVCYLWSVYLLIFTFLNQHQKSLLCTSNKIFEIFTLISTLHLKNIFSSHIAARVKLSVVLSYRMTTRNWNKSVEGLDFYDPIFSHLHERSAFSSWNFHIPGMCRWNMQYMRKSIKTKNCNMNFSCQCVCAFHEWTMCGNVYVGK